MPSRRGRRLPPRLEAAVEELVCLIREVHPDASFEIHRGHEDRRDVFLDVSAPGADPESVLDLVMDRLLELQVEQHLPLWVVPLDPPTTGGRAPHRRVRASPAAATAPS